MSPTIVYNKNDGSVSFYKVLLWMRTVFIYFSCKQAFLDSLVFIYEFLIFFKVKMVVGASGGSRIISAVAQTVIRAMLFNQTVKEAIDAPRFHNQYMPNETEYEKTVPKILISTLKTQYHQIFKPVEKQASVVQALVVMDDGYIHGNSDFRRKTSTYPAGY